MIKFNKQIKYKKTICAVLVVAAIPTAYFAGGYKPVDSYLQSSINKDLSALVENKYTGAIKETATVSSLNKVNNKINFIHSNKIKNKVKAETQEVRGQIELQTSLVDKSEHYDKETNPTKINKEAINKDIQASSGIKNLKVKTHIMKVNYTVIDRVEGFIKAKTEVDGLSQIKSPSEKDLPKYNTAKGYTDSVYYKTAKAELNKELSFVKEKIDNDIKQKKSNDDKTFKDKVDNIKSDSYKVSGSGSELNTVSTIDFKAIKFFQNPSNKSFSTVIVIDNNKLIGYKKISISDVNKDFEIKVPDELKTLINSGSIKDSTSSKEVTKKETVSVPIEEKTTTQNSNKDKTNSTSSSNTENKTASYKEEEREYSTTEVVNILQLNDLNFSSDNEYVKQFQSQTVLVTTNEFAKLKEYGGNVIV